MPLRRRKSGLRKEQKPWLGIVGEVAWGTSLSLYEAILLWDKPWWWRLHFSLWRAYQGWNPDDVLDSLPQDEKLQTLAYGETPASTVRRALSICREHFPEADSLMDLGAGRGVLSMTAANLGWDVLAVEYLGEFLRRSQPITEAQKLSVQWVKGDFLKLPLAPSDIIHTTGTTYPLDFRAELEAKFAAECHTGQGILLQDWILEGERFEALVSIRLPVTWGSSFFTLHRVLEPVPQEDNSPQGEV